jgi:hypothetical protein
MLDSKAEMRRFHYLEQDGSTLVYRKAGRPRRPDTISIVQVGVSWR